MLSEKRNYAFKILVVGDSGVGKTSLLRRFVEDKFYESNQYSISENYFQTKIDLHSGSSIQLQLWDFAGQAKHRTLLNNFVAGARGALILFDMTRPLKIITILEWVNMVRQADISLPILLVGTKCDCKNKILVKKDQINHILEVFKINQYIESSSKDSINVFKVFYNITKEIME